MNYYLSDIRTLLINQGYTNVYIDRLIEQSQNTSLNEAIILMSEGGTTRTNVPDSSFDFAVYVRRQTAQSAGEDCRAIWKYLQGFQGGITVGANSVHFRRLTTRQAPMPFISNSTDSVYEFMFTMTAQVNNSDFLTIK